MSVTILTDFETRLVLEQTIENVEGVSNRSGNNDGVESGELVAGEVVVGDASADGSPAYWL